MYMHHHSQKMFVVREALRCIGRSISAHLLFEKLRLSFIKINFFLIPGELWFMICFSNRDH